MVMELKIFLIRFSVVAVLTLSGVTQAFSNQAIEGYKDAIRQVSAGYKSCSALFSNNEFQKAEKECEDAKARVQIARGRFAILKNPGEVDAWTLALNKNETHLQNLIREINSRANQVASSSAMAGARGTVIRGATQATKVPRHRIISFDPNEFNEEIISDQLTSNAFNGRTHQSIIDSPYPRIRVDGFSAGNVDEQLKLEHSIICAQWVFWLLQKKGVNPLKLYANGFGYADTLSSGFEIYFPNGLPHTAQQPAHCLVGVLPTDGENAWDPNHQWGQSAVYKSANKDFDGEEIAQYADQLRENFERVVIEVAGHTDGIGNEAHMMAASTQCAADARAMLIEYGVHPSRLVAKGYGRQEIKYGNAGSTENQSLSCVVTFRDLETL